MNTENPVSPELLEAYRQTVYRCEDLPIELTVSALSADADQLMSDIGVRRITVITAWNPESVLLDASDNYAWNQQLRLRIELLRKPFWEGVNLATDGSWPAEESFWVADLSSFERDELAREYKQNAVVEIEKGDIAKLVLIEPPSATMDS
ncbi:MAG: hypothetical protein ACI9HX_000597 [Pseudoalteromonas tetraodonis]|jgi:hypothetical protein